MDGSSELLSRDRLALLCRLSQTFNSSLDLDKVLNRVMDEVIAAVRAERGFVMLRSNGGELEFHVARGMDRRVIEQPEFQISLTVVERVAREGIPILTSDAQRDDRFSMRQSVMILGLRSILCVPLALQDRILGVIYVDNRLQSGLFLEEDLELLTSIASTAAIAVENARLYQVAVEKGRMERELQMAREVQTSLLPSETPLVAGWEFAATWQPARQVAGDYYDFVAGPEDHLGLVIADVSDKGMHAALLMAVTRSIVRASMSRVQEPAAGIASANRLIYADAAEGMFVTLFYACLRPDDGNLTYVNAGHNPAVVVRQSAGAGNPKITELPPGGTALGIMADFSYEQGTLELAPGDLLVLYTDGVTDASNDDHERFGMERLRRLVVEHHAASAPELVAAMEAAVSRHADGAAQFDDMAILVARRQLGDAD